MFLKPIQGLVPRTDLVADVAAVPYDVVNTEEARALAADRPYDLLHVDRAEIDLPPDTDPYSDIVYETARRNLDRLVEIGVLLREEAPCLYLYQQQMGGHIQTGLIGGCHVDDYENDIIRKHEKTRKVKEDDRTKLVDTLCAHTGPIFLTYRDRPEIDAVVERTLQEAPLLDFVAPDGIAHRVWRITDTAGLVEEFGRVPLAYVADGHHRSASAWRVGKERRAANPAHNGSEDYNWFLGVLFPASQLKILPYNRIVEDLNDLSEQEFLTKIREAGFQVSPTNKPAPDSPGTVHMYIGMKRWYALSWDASAITDPVESLDVSVLQNRLLGPILGIDDPRTSNRIDFVGGIRGTGELVKRVDSGEAVAFSMFPTTVDQLMAISDAGQIMPPKSTWFEPKLRSGLVVQTFEEKGA